jgi:hypothetical protein
VGRKKKITRANLPDLEDRAKALGISIEKAEELINVPTFIFRKPKPGESDKKETDGSTSPRGGDICGEEGETFFRDVES